MVEQGDTAGGTPFGDDAAGSAPGGSSQGGTGRIDVQGMLGQLQAMITKVAVASEPALREVAAKAAELAAVAAEHAGPIAHTIADKTDEVSHAVAGRAQDLATSIRAAGGRGDASGAPVPPDAKDVTDPAEESPSDGA